MFLLLDLPYPVRTTERTFVHWQRRNIKRIESVPFDTDLRPQLNVLTALMYAFPRAAEAGPYIEP